MERAAIQRFRIVARVGAGGMGIVYRAFDPQLEREVAIKVLSAPDDAVRTELPSTRTLVLRDDAAAASSSMLLAEARVMARLSHPNVVPVYEVGLDGDDLFVVMEYVDGEDLRSWLATPRTTREILAVFAQAARGLEAAHARNVVHRDFKPENVLIGRDGRVRVVDFGLSWLTGASPLIRVIDRGGTPGYMAPELWRGTVTPAADVYAACMATAEAFGCDPRDPAVDVPAALRARRVPAHACAMIAAGLAEAPERRPAIGQIVAALDRRSSRSRTIAAAVAVVVAAAVAGLGALGPRLVAGPSSVPCTDDASLLEGRWSAAVRDQLRAKLVAAGAVPGRDGAHRALDAADTRARELVAARRQVCEAEARAEITAAQAALNASCLERRAMELGAIARVSPALQRARSGELEERFLAVTPVTCIGLELPPLGDRAAVEKLYERYVAFDRSAAAATPEAAVEAAAIVQAAAALGDAELEVRAGILRGGVQLDTNQLPASSATLERAYQRAVSIRSEDQQAIALTERSTNAMRGGDQREAKLLAQLARGLIDKPSVPVRTRFRVYRTLGRAELVRGEYPAAVELLRGGLTLLERSGERSAYFEIYARMDLTDALAMSNRSDDSLALALETAARAKQILGDSAHPTAQAVNQVGKIYMHRGEPAKSLGYRRQALAVLAATMPPGHALLLYQRGEVAETLVALNEADAARDELSQIVGLAEHNPGVHMWLTHWQTQLAQAFYDSGRYEEGLTRYATVVEQTISEHGAEHATTLERRFTLGELQIDAGQLADAAKTIAALELAYGRRTDSRSAQQLARVRGELGAKLALARGRARQADDTARLARAALAETGAPESERAATAIVLGMTCVEQGKYLEAQRLLNRALEVVRADHASEGAIAVAELALARAEYGLGLRAGARARAERVRDVLARYRGHQRARREVAAFLATTARGKR